MIKKTIYALLVDWATSTTFGIVFASKGYKVCLNDINKDVADQVKNGELPYVEYGAEPLLKKTLANGNLSISLDSKSISEAKL